jgi:hypothetical protein
VWLTHTHDSYIRFRRGGLLNHSYMHGSCGSISPQYAVRAKVHSAKVMDYEGIKTLMRRADTHFPRLSHLWVDAGYRGEDKGKDWVEKTLGWSVDLVERPRKVAPEEVLMPGPGSGPKKV